MVALRMIVGGRVQGVGFRDAALRAARRHGVAGWVGNRSDGRVEAWVEGERKAVADMRAWVEGGGPRAAVVDEVEVVEVEVAGHEGFEVRD